MDEVQEEMYSRNLEQMTNLKKLKSQKELVRADREPKLEYMRKARNDGTGNRGAAKGGKGQLTAHN